MIVDVSELTTTVSEFTVALVVALMVDVSEFTTTSAGVLTVTVEEALTVTVVALFTVTNWLAASMMMPSFVKWMNFPIES